MNRVLTVREYESIACASQSDGKGHCLEESLFHRLLEMIQSYSASDADILDFMRIGYRRGIGETVTAQNYVGLIQVKKGCQIEILPKVSLSEGESLNETRRILIKMLQSMKDFPSRVIRDTDLSTGRMSLYEIFISMYLREVQVLVKHGIRSAYVPKEENLTYYRGKLLVNQQIRQNLPHKERFYMAFDEYDQNGPENRIVKATLLKLQRQAGSMENVRRIRQFLPAFESVEPSQNLVQDFAAVRTDRAMRDYAAILPWSKVFLMNRSFTSFTGAENAWALLFPMEKVFESYVAQQIRRIFSRDGWSVSTQDESYFLFSQPESCFQLRPDIVLRKGDRTVILDTKWKMLGSSGKRNYGISQSDIYQMYAYSRKYDTPEVWLLYPVNDAMRNHEPIFFRYESEIDLQVFFVDLQCMEESMNGLRNRLG